MGSGKPRWKLTFHKSFLRKHQNLSIPNEFLCPISRSLMADPVIVSSGHTFERHCANACKSLCFSPVLPDGSVPDFSAIIPNLALRTAILNWCECSLFYFPKPLDFLDAEKLVRALMESGRVEKPGPTRNSPDCEAPSPTTPLPMMTRPACYSSSSSSSDLEALHANSIVDEDEFVGKLKGSIVFEQENCVISLRKLTRTREETRVLLCTPRMLAALRPLIASRYASIQVNAVAVLVNLSLEKQNKVKIVRSGVVPPLIDVLKGGSLEAQDHAAGALFSLALEDQNKTAIGVLGALPPLLHALRSESERTRHDSVLALYHLSLVQSNRAKMVKLGFVQALLGMVRSGHMMGRILLVLCNLAASQEGRAAMLDGGAVECFVSLLKREELESEAIRESCVAALYGLSHGGLRFRGLAKEAGAEEAVMKVEESGSDRVKVKAKKILDVLRQKDEEEEEVDWEQLLNSEDDCSQTKFEPRRGSGVNSG